jgi:predicted dehydrogenase
MERVRVGVIGLGWPGQRHIEAYLRQPDVDLVAVCDANEQLLTATRTANNVPHAFTEIDELFSLSGLDAISICLPNFLHAPVAIKALESGRHVLCEKPLARTVAEGEQIAAAVAGSGHVFMMALNNRFRPDTLAVKALVETGGLGEIYYAKAGWLRRRWNPIVRGWFTRRELSGGGPLIDLGVHMLDLALWYMGNPRPAVVTGATYSAFREQVSRRIGYIDTEDLATGFVRLVDGRTILVEASWIGFSEQPDFVYCDLFGTRGGATIQRPTEGTRIFTEPAPDLPLTAAAVGMPDRMALTYESFNGEIRHFVDCVRAGEQPSAPVGQGLDVLRILDALYRSAESGREVVIADGQAAPPAP